MKIERFEDIEAWKEARELTQGIYRTTGGPSFSKDFGLRDQVQRAAVSIMANTVHPVKYMRCAISRGRGYDANSDDEFVRFLRYALRSATEVQSHLYVAADQGYMSKDEFTQLYDQATEAKKLISGFTPWNNVRSVLFHGVNPLLEALTLDPGHWTIDSGFATGSMGP